MFVLDSARWLRGYVDFDATGKFPERFLNLTLRENIQLWNPIGEKGKLHAQVSVSEYKYLRPIAKKTGVKLKVTKKSGLPIIMHNNRNRSGLVAGLCLFIVLTSFLSSFIWSIDVSGLDRISKAKVITLLEENGLTSGVFKNSLSSDKITRRVLLELDDISWMKINLVGTTAQVTVSEGIETPEIIPENEPCDLVATMDGQIHRMDVASGTTLVNAQDGVVKGQTLVSGVVVDQNGNYTLEHSSGVANATVKAVASIEIPLNYTISIPTGQVTKRYRGKVFGVEFPLSFKHIPSDDNLRTSRYDSLTVNKTEVPLQVQTEAWYSCNKELISLDEKLAKKQGETRTALYELFNLLDTEILNREVTYSNTDESYIVNISYECMCDIAETAELDKSYIPKEKPSESSENATQ